MKKLTTKLKFIRGYNVSLSTIVIFLLIIFGNDALGDELITVAHTDSDSYSGSTFQTVVTTANIDVTNVDSVIVFATFEVTRVRAAVNRTVAFQLINNGNNSVSPEIIRYIAAKNDSPDEYGIGSMVYIFDVRGQSGNITFSLQHRLKVGSQSVTTTASIVAMALNTATSPYPALNSDLKYLSAGITSTSSSYVGISELTTDGVLLPATGGMLVAASINCQKTVAENADDAGTWILQQKKGINGTWSDVGSGIQRSMSTIEDAGLVTLYYFIEDQPRDYYYYRVAQKVSVGTGVTIETLEGSTIAAVALSYVESNVGYRFKIETASGTENTSSSSASDATAITATPNGTNALVLAQFAIGSTAAAVPTYNLNNTTGTNISAFEERRTLSSATDMGAGGIVGLATGLTGSTVFSLQHQTTAGTLTTSNIQLGVLNLTSSPSPGYWIGGSAAWNSTTNWADGSIPTSTTNVTIFDNTNEPIIDADAVCKTINIVEDGSVTVSSGKTLTVSGDLFVESGGSFISEGTTNVTGDVKAIRFVEKSIWHYISSPVGGQAVNDGFMTDNNVYSPNSGTNYNFYRWDEPTNEWIIYGDESFLDGSFVNGRGYAASFTTDRNLEFSGSLNTEDQTITVYKTVGSGREGSNLIGNPFLAPISLSDFTDKENNPNIEGTVYFWSEQDGWNYPSDNYAYWNGSGSIGAGTQVPSNQIGVAQGFMVQATGNNVNVNFTTAMQEHANPNYFKAVDISRIKLSVQYQNDYYNETLIAMLEDATLGFDRDYDGRKLLGDANLYLYTQMPEDDELCAIQGIPFPEDESIVLPLTIESGISGLFDFKVVSVDNIGENIEVLLEDKLSNQFTDLKKVNNIELQLNEGITDNRFLLHFSNTTGVVNTPHNNDISIYSFNRTVNVLNPDSKAGMVNIYNVSGQLILSDNLTGEHKQEFGLNSNDVILLVQIQTKNDVVSQKLILN